MRDAILKNRLVERGNVERWKNGRFKKEIKIKNVK